MTYTASFRWALPDDSQALGEIMFDAVRGGPSPYSEAQREAWVPAPPNGAQWDARLASQEVVVAERDGRILGFMTLAERGYVDLAFIRPEAQGHGLFGRMLERLEGRARAKGETRLWVHASLRAAPSFRAHGFTLLGREQVTLRGQSLERCEMEKILTD